MKEFRGLSIAFVAMILWCMAAEAQSTQPAVHGTGTTNTIPVFMGSSVIGNSIMNQSGGNINVSGGLVATTLSGNGSGITGVSASTLGGLPASAFAQLGAGRNAFAGSVSAASFSGSGSGLTNVNAAQLGGVSASAFAQLGLPNIFTKGQTINGTLTLGGAINNALTLQGNVSDSFGNESANVIGGFGGSGSVSGNSVASGIVGATIAGGGGFTPNTVSANWGTVGGGLGNTASGQFATVAGGQVNTAGNDFATVGGGGLNTASANSSTVAGGAGNTASGNGAMVAGGEGNTAAGDISFAAGCSARANNQGSFVWSGVPVFGTVANCNTVRVSDNAGGQFIALSPGGVTFYSASDLSTGVTLAAGSGSWAMVSDRNVKSNFSDVDGQALLERLAALPVSTWNYKAQADSIRHMGPTAQDFRAAFGLGEDDRHISNVDAEGIALAAIQALYQRMEELKRDKDREIAELRARLAHLEQLQ